MYRPRPWTVVLLVVVTGVVVGFSRFGEPPQPPPVPRIVEGQDEAEEGARYLRDWALYLDAEINRSTAQAVPLPPLHELPPLPSEFLPPSASVEASLDAPETDGPV